jgi:2-polyprenyl-3-methyl-5-hydroxy-6-metoxy-1,4-benzoquinol methylase
MSQWSRFYESRVNSSYQEYFENKYSLLLCILSRFNNVAEEGIGIGSISKFLSKKGIQTSGMDLCPQMLELCRINNPGIVVQRGNIFTDVSQNEVVVTHGVLEHFSDEDIHIILKKYKTNKQKSIHYVPLIGHGKPSFGDERLMESTHWISEFKPDASIRFNQGKDLILIFN